MAFVEEKVINEEDQKYFDSFGFINPVTGKKVTAKGWLGISSWVIDRERNVFLTALGGQGLEHSERPMYYSLVWKNQVIEISTFTGGKADIANGRKIWWKITVESVPSNLLPEMDSIAKLIKEAFIAYDNTDFDSVEFKSFLYPKLGGN